MAIINGGDEKFTPNEAAKEILMDRATGASYWRESHIFDMEKITPGEAAKIDAALEKQYDRLQKFFGRSGYSMG